MKTSHLSIMSVHGQTSILEVTTSIYLRWISIGSDGEGIQPGLSKRVESNRAQPSAKMPWEEAVGESPTTPHAMEKGRSCREPLPSYFSRPLLLLLITSLCNQ